MGYNERAAINERIKLYRQFNKQNPHVKGIGSILTIITLCYYIVSIITILMWLSDIDKILLREYRAKGETIREGNFSDTRFSSDLENYLRQII